MSRYALAKRAGVTPLAIEYAERGSYSTERVARALASALGVSVETIATDVINRDEWDAQYKRRELQGLYEKHTRLAEQYNEVGGQIKRLEAELGDLP